MTTLELLISQISNLSSSEDVYTELTAKTNKVIIYNGEQSIAAIEKIYGTEFAITLVVTLQAVLDGLIVNGDTTNAAYLSIYFDRVTRGVGLNFADDTVQARLDTLVPYLTQDVVNKLKAMGSVYKSKWELNSNEPEPTLEEVQSTIQNILNRREAGAYWSRVLAVVNPMLDSGNTATEIKAAAAEVT